MLLKIYLGISVLTLILFALQNLSGINRVKNKYGDELDKFEENKDITGTIMAWLKMAIVSFIPLYNILMLIILIFFTSKLTEKIDENVKNAVEKAREENKKAQ